MVKARHILTVAGGAALSAGLLGAGTALAAAPSQPHTVSFTQTVHGSFTEDQATNPCTGDSMVLQFDGNQVQHVTFFPASDEVWATFTEEGAFTGTDQQAGVSYSGHATAWGNFNINQTNGNSTFTLSVRATGSDGSVLVAHIVTHQMLDSEGNVVTEWDKMPVLTCGG